MALIDPLTKEKTQYKKLQFLYEAWFTFSQFSLGLKFLLIVFVVGCIPVYFVSRIVYAGINTTRLQSYLVESIKPAVLGSQIEVGQTEVYQAGTNSYSVYAQIHNPNLQLAAPEVNYEFTLYGSSGNVIKTIPGKTYLLLNEHKSVILPREDSDEKITRAELKVLETKFVNRYTIPEVDLSASTPQFYNQDEPTAFAVEGLVFNNSPYSLKSMNVKFLLYDFQGNILSVSQRREDSLTPFERRAYKQLWPNLYVPNVSRVVVETETNVLDRHNLRLQDY